mmetsp:Transcript_16765/g.26644  ORF Transcript_16765/g.26644 Transcript_16765/m.26644 type:complete len:274 (+) Transcript_16765:116-937(+)
MSWISTHFASNDDFDLYLATLKNHNYCVWDIHYQQALNSVNHEINDLHQRMQQTNTMSLTCKAAMTPYQGLSTQFKSSNDFYAIAMSQHLDSIINNSHKGIQKNSREIDKLMKSLNDTEERKRKLIEYDRKLKQSKNEWDASQQAQLQLQSQNNTHNTHVHNSADDGPQKLQMQNLQQKVDQLGDMIMNVQTHILDGDDDDDSKHEDDPTQELRDWLTDEVGLPQYIDTFIENGFEDMESIANVTMDDLIEIKIGKLGHRKKLISKIQALQQQ